MNYPRLALAALAATVMFFAFGFLTEGWLIRGDFAPSAALYRTADALQRYMPIGLASMLAGMFAASALYAKWSGGICNLKSGLRFGLLAGVLAVCIHALPNLVTLNMDVKLGVEIAVSTFLQWVLSGATIGAVYRPAANAR